MITNAIACKVFYDFFGTKKIEKLQGKTFDMTCEENDVKVVFNINAQGQIQLKLLKDGFMRKLANDYSFTKMQAFDFTKMLLVLDFEKNEIRFKDPNELRL